MITIADFYKKYYWCKSEIEATISDFITGYITEENFIACNIGQKEIIYAAIALKWSHSEGISASLAFRVLVVELPNTKIEFEHVKKMLT